MTLRAMNSQLLVERFKSVTNLYGDMPAIEFDRKLLTYDEIDSLSDVLVDRMQYQGICPRRDIVVIDGDRNPLLVIAVLACVKAKCVFYVIGEFQPEAYVAQTLENADSIFWLSAKDHSNAEKAMRIARDRLTAYCTMADAAQADNKNPDRITSGKTAPDQADGEGSRVDDGMYLIATSGTTGRPKLVLTGEKSILNFIDWYREEFILTRADKFSLLSGLGYDPLIRDIFTPLCIGACLSIPTKKILGDRRRLQSWINDNRISVIHATPSLAELIFDTPDRDFDCARLLVVGGATLTADLAKRIKSRLVHGILVNVFGASETPQVMTRHIVENVPENSVCQVMHDSISLGKPIKGVEIQVLNSENKLCKDSEIGEIHIVSQYLALGYYGDPVLTSEKFLQTNSTKCRVFRTGDLGWVDGFGDLHFVGRKDRQIKHRGYRIQLEEIEHALLGLDGVTSAAVVFDKNNGNGKLTCYVQPKCRVTFDMAAIRHELVDILPTYMMPEQYKFIDKMPMNSNNKIDYGALDNIVPIARRSRNAQPREVLGEDRIAKELLSIWAHTLDKPISDIALDHNFFDVGGNSLLTVRLVDSINKKFRKQFKTTDLFVYSNINELTECIASDDEPTELKSSVINSGRWAARLNRMQSIRNRRMRKNYD